MSDPVRHLNTALEGRYRIREQLGAGGMATVYLAEDLKHHRQVALKVMKPELTAVVGAERFLGEIETTANLTHPHILPLHDSGEVEGILFYVMPYVEGESLREKIDREKQLPVDEAVEIAEDLAEALDYAHRHGVIHRDIKPANVLIHEGRPLIADFGIALAVGAAGGPRLTETGLSLGTPYYMSPEQATGDQVVGPSTDIYALGCVLYEMLVGEPPYTGATAQAVLGKIIQGGGASARQERSSVPPNVDAAIRKALEKLPADRFTSASAFARALGDSSFRHGPGTGADLVGKASRWRGATLAAGALTAVLAIALGWVVANPDPPPPVVRYQIQFPPEQELVDIFPPTFTLSPDGSALVYTGPGPQGPRLWVKRRDQLEATPLAGTDGGLAPAVSPAGDWVAYHVGNELRKTPLVGGAAVTVHDSVNTGVPGSAWLDDETLAYVDDEWRLRRVPAAGGDAEVLWEPPEERYPFFPEALPGGRALLFSLCDANCTNFQEVRALDLDSGEDRVVTPGSVRGIYAPGGHVLTVRPDGSVFAHPFDVDALETTGNAVPVLEGVKVDAGVSPDLALAPDGTLFMISGPGVSTEVELVWVSRTGQMTPVDPGWTFDPGGANRGWALSPDDDRVALRANTDAGFDIWIKELPNGPYSRLTFDPAEDRMPRWTPDGESVTFLSTRQGSLDMWAKRADGTGEAELIYDHVDALAQGFWTPDGQRILLRTAGTAGVEGGRDILMVAPGEDTAAVPLLTGEYDEWGPAISADGRWLAYQSTETGANEVFVRPFPDVNSGKWQISTGGGVMPLWGHSGRELFYVSGGGEMVAAEITTTPRFRVGERRVLFSIPEEILVSTITGMYDIAGDDQRFLMARHVVNEDRLTRTVVIQNWLAELKERVGR